MSCLIYTDSISSLLDPKLVDLGSKLVHKACSYLGIGGERLCSLGRLKIRSTNLSHTRRVR